MTTVLVTGSMGSGKSTVIACLEAQSYPVFKADTKARELMSIKSPCYSRLKQIFNEDRFFKSNGEWDRKQLAKDIFQNADKRKALSAIIYPLIRESFKKWRDHQKNSGESWVFYEAPLISLKMFDSFDKKILLVCPKSIKRQRLIKKGWTSIEIKQRWRAQIPESQAQGHADFIIDNSGHLQSLKRQVKEVLCSMGV